MNVATILREQAARTPDTAAIIDLSSGRERLVSFSALDRAASHVAGTLARSGIRPGDAVLVLVPMSSELYVALAGIFRSGAIAMFLDPSAGLEHIARCCALRAPAALIASSKALWLRAISPSLARIPKAFDARALCRHVRDERAELHERSPASSGGALLTFTSGSTGAPKAALRSHGFLGAQLDALRQSLELAQGGVDVATMPIVLLANLACGVTSLVSSADLRKPGRADPAVLAAEIDRYRATSIVASPALLEHLADHRRRGGGIFGTLRKVFGGGAPVFPRLLDALCAVAPHAEVVAIYGSTEAEPIAHLRARDVGDADRSAMQSGKGLLAGLPVPSISLKIVRVRWGAPLGPLTPGQLAALECAAGEAGEIVVSGAHVLPGYLDGRGDEETKTRVGERVWHRTGDLGSADERGRLWLLGRCAAKIEDSRGALYPFAVECAASFAPEVRRSAVLGTAQRRVLAVELAAGADRETVAARLRARLAWAELDDIVALPKIPVDKRHNAKVDYPALQRVLERS
ncbi:MAG: AMP-binding protein [Candidatus Eremiobacteraeota bacterium]|nr:AMP-binding protein [Candidatus Eremiobacteraeota bacterium]